MQATLQKRFSNGLQFNAAYTWSKAIGVCCSTDNSANPLVNALAFFDRNRTLLPFDRTHNFQLTTIYQLPFGRGRAITSGNRVVTALISGWQLNGLLSLMTGNPFNVTADGATLLMPGSTQTPDLINTDVQKLGGIGRGNPYFDRAAFREVPRGENRFGTLGYHALRGSEFFNTDIGLFREFVIKERYRTQFRVEWFNWTNTPKFNNPNGSINSGDFMFVTGTNSGGREPNGDRILRLGLRFAF